ncbi:MAG: NAD(P)/FAD-dependent oxidoreductase [Eubacterium sp.]|nr:NAD(P)/FAD-dependent oxidoreductase [Eubacterium sp.]
MYDIAIIGGGAAGLMAAISAAGHGAHTVIVEHNSRVGKKLLVTGNGKCNFTNELQEEACYYSADPAFVMSALGRFGHKETVRFFEELGVLAVSKNGYCYPNSGQASSILDILRLEARRLNVEEFLGEHVVSVTKKDCFYINTEKTQILATSCILATGGKAAVQTGSDGSGYRLAKKFGHSVTGLVPALVPLTSEQKDLKMLAGVRTKAKLHLLVAGEEKSVEEGELQLTAYGISGIPVFQFSRTAAYGLSDKKKVTVQIDFLPDRSLEWLQEELYKRKKGRHKRHTMEEAMTGVLNKKLVEFLRKQSGISGTELMETISDHQLEKFTLSIKTFPMNINGTKPFANAQVTAGGVDLSQVKERTFESRLVNGLYFAGEILDVDGICGGYNLQWAWTSGYLAGQAAAMDCKTEYPERSRKTEHPQRSRKTEHPERNRKTEHSEKFHCDQKRRSRK